MRGDIKDTSPFVAPVIYSLRQAREDLEKWTADLSPEQVWSSRSGLTPLGFQLKHIAGSVDRLTTYLEERPLSDTQMSELNAEGQPDGDLTNLLARIEEVFTRVERVFRSLDPARLAEPRYIGRKRLPTTAIGLLVHIAEHTQRHVGEAIVTVKALKSAG